MSIQQMISASRQKIDSVCSSAPAKIGAGFTVALTSVGVRAEDADAITTAAGQALDQAKGAVDATGPKVILAIAGIIVVGIVISLLRKA